MTKKEENNNAFGFNEKEQLMANAAKNTLVAKEGLNSIKPLSNAGDNLTLKKGIKSQNKSIINEIYFNASNSVLISNELNTSLLNLIGDVITLDGLANKPDPDYSYFDISNSEFGQLDIIYGIDTLVIGSWSADWTIDDANPDMIFSESSKLDTEDYIKISWRTNASVYNGAFLNNENSSVYLQIETKRALDSMYQEINKNIGDDIRNSVKIGRYIPGFDNKTKTEKSMTIIYENMIKMTAANRDYNPLGHSRALISEKNESSEIIKIKAAVIVDADFISKAARSYSNAFNNNFINIQKKFEKTIFDPRMKKNEVIIIAKNAYLKNERLSKMFSNVQPATTNTINFSHKWIRRAIVLDQQQLIFSPLIPDVEFSFSYDESTSKLTVVIINKLNKTILLNVKEINKNENNAVIQDISESISSHTEITAEVVITNPEIFTLIQFSGKISEEESLYKNYILKNIAIKKNQIDNSSY